MGSAGMPEIETASDILKLFRTADELPDGEESIITGENLPSYVQGCFVRGGPGKFDFEDNFTLNHWLDGFSLLSKFEIFDGRRVKFSSQYLQSDAYLKAIKAQKPLLTEFGTKAYPDLSKNIMSRFMSSLELSDNSISPFRLGSELFMASHTTFCRKVNTSNLSTHDKMDYSKCFGQNGVSPHFLKDENGDVYNVGFSVSTGLKYNVIKISGDKNYTNPKDLTSTTIASIPSRWNTSISFFHSFGMTKQFIIFIECPITISLKRAAKSLIRGDSFKDWLEWKPKEHSRFFLIQKSNGQLIKTEYVSQAFFFLHVINSYEDENNQVIIDLIKFPSPSVLDNLYMKKLRSQDFEEKDPPAAHRFVLPLVHLTGSTETDVNLVVNSGATARRIKGGQIVLESQKLTETGLELPVINQSYIGRENKYFYATGSVCKNYFSNAICKVNTQIPETILWRDKNFYYPGEPMFVANPDGESEDDGVIISAVTSVREDFPDFLLFLHAKDFQELARFPFKADIPQAMHGIFISTNQN